LGGIDCSNREILFDFGGMAGSLFSGFCILDYGIGMIGSEHHLVFSSFVVTSSVGGFWNMI
jgi:hypothetical protein